LNVKSLKLFSIDNDFTSDSPAKTSIQILFKPFKTKTMKVHIGLDIGSISINTVLLNDDKEVIENRYTYCLGKPFHVLKTVLSEIIEEYGTANIGLVAVTGSGGKQAAELIGGDFVNEIIAQSSSVAVLYPHVNTIIEMGGEDSKLIFMHGTETASHSQLSDFAMNSLCAAGTGSFLDQQAKRIGVSIENEFGNLALRSKKPPRIAGRCSVFAKSDMIHLQQIATPLHDIVAGLCFAVARNFKSTLGRGKTIKPPIIFQGGVAANAGMIRAFKEILEAKEEEFIIPEYYASMGAIGALYYVFKKADKGLSKFKGLEKIDTCLTQKNASNAAHNQLVESKAIYYKEIKKIDNWNGEKIEVSLGVDVGSLSTNLVLIDKDDNVIARRYLPTASKPINAIQRGLKEIYEEIGDRVVVKSAGSTGSGRYLTGDFIGADIIQNEITAQATAAIAHDPTVDTIFEIGGQDSKYIRIEDGVIVDFEMNKVCAAGTGSFLEEQAEKLDINIVEEFGEIALQSEQPVKLGNRCTVFMETDLNSHQQKGAAKEDLVGGLAYSIVQNYLQKVVGIKPVGEKIFFQGGVTNNKSVVAAFEKITGKPIIIPPHFDVTGAIGAAMLARKAVGNGQSTRFKGFEIYDLPFSLDSFPCKKCTNYCEIQRVRVGGEKKGLFYGGRCDRYDIAERKGKGEGIPNYFEERTELLMGNFEEKPENGKISIGIPRGLMLYYQQFPFWRTLFEELGFRVVLSEPSDQQMVKKSLEVMVAETCLPVEMMHGHVLNLFEKGVDYIFTPFIVDAKADKDNPTNNCNCPWVQTHPFMIKSAFAERPDMEKLLIPTLHFRYFGRVLNGELSKFMKEQFSISRSKVVKAIKKADEVQTAFEKEVKIRGRLALASIPEGKKGLVILGRPYNTTDPLLNQRLVEKLINLETIPIPVDYMPIEEENIFDDYPMMYWPNGQKMIAASRLVRKNKNLYAVYLGNFRCGPDSFISHYVKEEMKGKPFLHLEVDEHSADAGMITRLEAFLDSLEGYQKVRAEKEEYRKKKRRTSEDKLTGRTLYFPYARDIVHAISAATRSIGIDSEVLPMVDETDLEIARKLTNGQECFPFICTTGSFVSKLMEPGADPSKIAFFMPDHNGPCRFGDYNKLHRIIFDRLGYEEAELITPSNDDSYASLAPGKAGNRFRMNAWKGIVAIDMLKKLLQEKRPYEINKGQTETLYNFWLQKVIKSVENNGKGLADTLEQAGEDFSQIPFKNGERRPLIAIVGEVFMRDNPFCSGYIVQKLEDLGAEIIMAPFAEWVVYSSYRYWRDSVWKGDIKGLFKSRVQQFAQHFIAKKLHNAVSCYVEMEREVPVKEMLRRTDPYVHHDYDGDPIASIGASSSLYETGISGVIHIMPFTCMPGTLISSVTTVFRKDHNNIPWENIPYDGQEDTGIDTRLQAFMHQAKEYRERNKLEDAMHLQPA
jgi:predicted CoA-substrate-specific enzyme activase